MNKIYITTIEALDGIYIPPCWMFSELIGNKTHFGLKIGILYGGHKQVLDDMELVYTMYKYTTSWFQIKSNLAVTRGFEACRCLPSCFGQISSRGWYFLINNAVNIWFIFFTFLIANLLNNLRKRHYLCFHMTPYSKQKTWRHDIIWTTKCVAFSLFLLFFVRLLQYWKNISRNSSNT